MFGLSGGAVAGIVGAGASLLGGGGSKQTGTQTQSTQAAIDPRMGQFLYGDGVTSGGALNNIIQQGDTAQKAGTAAYGSGMDDYLGQYGRGQFDTSVRAADALQNSNINAPQMQAAQAGATPAMQAAQSQAASINAPAQNGVNTASAYNNMINGNAGANPYLTNALQSAVDQTNASYQQNQTSLTNNLQRNILPGINSSAQLSGQYGGTRQGIAQGNAIGDYTNQLNNSNLQLGLANSANTTGQQATAYNQGQDRALSAMNTLSGQQYGVATNNAQLQQQSNLQNAQLQNTANATNYAGQQQTSLANAGYQNTANSNNLQAGLNTNQLNSANQATGINAASGLLGTAYTQAQNNNNYDLNRAGQVTGLLSPFTGLGASSTTSSPLYTNPTGNALGGATTALGLYNSYNQANPKAALNGSTANNQYSGGNDGWTDSSGYSLGT